MVVEKQLISKISWRLMPFLGILYLIAYIDRQNVSFAKLQMVDALGMSEYAMGLELRCFLSAISSLKSQATCFWKNSVRADGSREFSSRGAW